MDTANVSDAAVKAEARMFVTLLFVISEAFG